MKYIYLYIFIMLTFISKGQNLVPNSSFETYTACPNAPGKVEYAAPWTAATANSSTDYFNACSPAYNVPNTPTSFQNAHTGNAIVGFYFAGASSFDLDSREYLQVQLTTPLIQDKIYYTEFYVNLHDASNVYSPCNNIAANFSITRPYTVTLGTLQPLTPHIMNSGNPIIADRVNWVKVSGCYTAQGGEEYLTIGNFFNNANTQFTGTTSSSYYFVDDVLVEEITGSCTTGIDELSINEVKLFPNPAENSLHITASSLKNKEVLTVKLHDVLGKEVLSAVYKEELDLSCLEKGIYFLSLYQDNQLLVTKKVVKE